MTEIKIRDYRNSDWSTVLQLVKETMEYHIKIQNPVRYRTYTMALLRNFLLELTTKHRLKKGKLLLAVDDNDHAVGFVYGEVEKPNKEVAKISEKSGFITELYVAPAQRGKKVAQDLMTAMEKYLSGIGCKLVRLKDVHDTNLPAKKLYEKIGYQPRVIEYVKKIS